MSDPAALALPQSPTSRSGFFLCCIDSHCVLLYSLGPFMARRCVKTGKKTAFGNTRSHSNRHTRRPFKANVQRKRVYDSATHTFKTMNVSTSYLRTMAKRLQQGKKA